MFKKLSSGACFNSQNIIEAGSVSKFLVNALAQTNLFTFVKQGVGGFLNKNTYYDLLIAYFTSKDDNGDETTYELMLFFSYYTNTDTLTILDFRIDCSFDGGNSVTYESQAGSEGFNSLPYVITFDGGIVITFGGNNTYRSFIISDVYNLRNHSSKLMIIKHTEKATVNQPHKAALSYTTQLTMGNEGGSIIRKNITAEIMNNADFTEFHPIMFKDGYRTRNVMWSDFTEYVNFVTDTDSDDTITADHDDNLRDYRDDLHNTQVWGYRIGHLLILND